MPPPPTFTPLEWRLLAGACEAVAEKEHARAEACPDRKNAASMRHSTGVKVGTSIRGNLPHEGGRPASLVCGY